MRSNIKNLDIETYRGINDLEIDNIGDINIIVGDNNTGKTSVLEAIRLVCDPSEFNLIKTAIHRDRITYDYRNRLSMMESVLYLFNKKCKENDMYNIMIRADRNGSSGYFNLTGNVIKNIIAPLTVREDTFYYENDLIKDSSYYENKKEIDCFEGIAEASFEDFYYSNEINLQANTREFKARKGNGVPVANQFVGAFDHVSEDSFKTTIRTLENKNTAVALLKYFDEGITDLRYISEEDRFIPMVEHIDKGTLPLVAYGDGMKKVLMLLNAVMAAEGGVVMVDEFETAIHTTAMIKCFKFILAVAEKLDVQMFMTTHSLEAVDKLLASGDEMLENIRVIRLKKRDNKTYARVLTGKEAKQDREKYDAELRI